MKGFDKKNNDIGVVMPRMREFDKPVLLRMREFEEPISTKMRTFDEQNVKRMLIFEKPVKQINPTEV